jgi:hypothetical protein
MPTGTIGNPITLEAQYVNGLGVPTVPANPRVDIKNPLGVTLVNDDTPVAESQPGRYHYEYDIPGGGPVGAWQIIWTGTVDGEAVEETETFNVVSGGDIIIGGLNCDTPMWATVEDFLAYPGNELIDPDDAEELIIEGTWLLSGLILDRFHEAQCRTDRYRDGPALDKIQLAHTPVTEVVSVQRVHDCSEEASDIAGWCALSGGYVRIRESCGTGFAYTGQQRLGPGFADAYHPQAPLVCGCTDSVIEIAYKVANNLPPGTSRQVIKLATEFWKSSTGKKCSLPERITSVTKQNVSWTILDPMDFLDAGRTGIGSIDLWIRRVNGTGVAGLIDPLIRPQLLSSVITGCGSPCE